jgi:hypothetical protein
VDGLLVVRGVRAEPDAHVLAGHVRPARLQSLHRGARLCGALHGGDARGAAARAELPQQVHRGHEVRLG